MKTYITPEMTVKQARSISLFMTSDTPETPAKLSTWGDKTSSSDQLSNDRDYGYENDFEDSPFESLW